MGPPSNPFRARVAGWATLLSVALAAGCVPTTPPPTESDARLLAYFPAGYDASTRDTSGLLPEYRGFQP